jgi:hypothetical protein
MIRRRLWAAPTLLVLGMLIFTGAASGASILTSADQIAQVVSPPSNTGSFTISSMLRVKGDGQISPIPWPMPENQVFIVTRIIGYFIATDPTLNTATTFNLGDYYRMSPQITNGFGSFLEVITPGVPITNPNYLVYLYRNSDSTKTAITGVLNLRVMGYSATIN